MISSASVDTRSAMDRMYRRQRHIYDLTRKFYLLGRDELIAALQPPLGGAVLEIACGTGRNLIRAAKTYPHARFFGLDVSDEMLVTAQENVAAAGLSARISLAQGDATSFDPVALFASPSFDRVFISYALSMIPPWRCALEEAAERLAPGGALHIVDFGDQADWPRPVALALRAWLYKFGVTPRLDLSEQVRALGARRGLKVEFRPLYRRYAFLASIAA